MTDHLAKSEAGPMNTRDDADIDPMVLMNIAASVIREVGDIVSVGRQSGLGHVETKSSPTDLVTQWDTRAESVIRTRLAELRPGDGVVGEEGDATSSTTGITWLVDPIDGTTNFAYGLPGYAISIAAVDHKGSLAGAVLAPQTRELFVAARGRGAWLGGRRLACSSQGTLSNSLIGTGFSYKADIRQEQLNLVASIGARVRDIRRLGAAALDLCFVAAGRLDAYFEAHLHHWDFAAGTLIATEAGAVVTNFSGDPVTRGEVLASAPGIHAELIALLK